MNEDPFSLAGRRLLVTGASSGLGRAIAIACASRGARIVATGRDEPRLSETRAELAGEGHATVAADLNDAAGRDQVVGAAGTLDGVVHSAGISRLSPMRLATPQHLADVWKINYEAPMLLTQKLMGGGGGGAGYGSYGGQMDQMYAANR